MSIIDSSVKPKNITLHNGASISTSKSRFGGGSLFLDGSNKYASIPDNTDFGFGTGDFTIEMWVYPLDNNNWRTLVALGTHTNGLLWRIGTGGDQLYFNGNYWNWNASSVPLNVWSHLALVRNNGGIKVYINGTESFSESSGNTATNLGSSKAVNIGAYNPGSETFNGYIDEIRITKGIGTARYTSNFDVKTLLAPFPSSGTPITPPETISNLSVLARDQRADLSWTAPAEDNGGIITDYSLQYSTDNVAWSGYDHAASAAPSGMISGLTNGTTYSVRVAPINIAGTGSYVSQSNVVPILPPVLSISQEPLNNRVSSNSESATFSISAELTNNTNNSSFSYQWQKYALDYYNDYNYKWMNVDSGTSSSITLTSSDFRSYMDDDATGPIRCILTSAYETKNSKTVRLVNVASSLNSLYFYINAYQNDGGVTFGGNYYSGGYTGLNANQRTGIYVDNYSYSDYNDSWYTGNDTKLKFQYSLNGSSWNDVDSAYSYNFRKKSYYNTSFQIPPIDASGRVYFRFILEDLWPYTTNDGTSSTTESPYSMNIYYWIDYTATAPGEPSNVVADPGDGLAIVSWNAPTLTGGAPITSYTVQYSLNGGSWTTFGTSTSTSLMVTGLNNGSENNYTFKVAATNSAGTGSYSTASSSVSPDVSYASTPGVPTNITGIAGNTKVLLNWVAPSNIGKSVLTDYVIQLSTDDGETWENYVEPSPTSTPTPTPTPLPMFYSPSASWSSVGFSGNGTLNDKYLGSSSGGISSVSIRVTSAGKLHITADNISSDAQLTITRNSRVLSLGDSSSGYFASSFDFETMAVANGQNSNIDAGDLITISDPSDYLQFNNLRIWWTPFAPMAILLTSGTSYSVPVGATRMKAWAVGGGGGVYEGASGAGGTAFKTWSVTSGSTVTYSVGARGRNYNEGTQINPPYGNPPLDGENTTVTFGGTTITGNGGVRAYHESGYYWQNLSTTFSAGGGFSGGDGGANGGRAIIYSTAGAVGGNSQPLLVCSGNDAPRRPATNVSGLLEAVALAGGVATQVCGVTAAFGSSGYGDQKFAQGRDAGFGGGMASGFEGRIRPAGNGAVVLYFT